MVAGRLFVDGLPEYIDNLFPGRPGSQHGLDINFLAGKQTCFYFSVSGQPQAVAGTAEMPADGGNEADFAGGTRKSAEPCRTIRIRHLFDLNPVDLMNGFHELLNRHKQRIIVAVG